MRVFGGLLHGFLEKGIDGPVSFTRFPRTGVWVIHQHLKRETRPAHGKPIHQPARGTLSGRRSKIFKCDGKGRAYSLSPLTNKIYAGRMIPYNRQMDKIGQYTKTRLGFRCFSVYDQKGTATLVHSRSDKRRTSPTRLPLPPERSGLPWELLLYIRCRKNRRNVSPRALKYQPFLEGSLAARSSCGEQAVVGHIGN